MRYFSSVIVTGTDVSGAEEHTAGVPPLCKQRETKELHDIPM
jgi:hypothetical protein